MTMMNSSLAPQLAGHSLNEAHCASAMKVLKYTF